MPRSDRRQSRSVRRVLPLLVLLPLLPLSAAERFPAEIRVDGEPLRRNGVGLCEWGVLGWNLYHAALWMEVPCSDGARIVAADATKRIELLFCRDLSLKQMHKAYRTSFAVNATEEEKKALAEEIDAFVSHLTAADKGSRLRMTHLPGQGLLLDQDGRTLGPLGGDPFARLVFRLYLGSNPPTKPLRDRLLGEHPSPISLLRPKEPDGAKPAEAGDGAKTAPPVAEEEKTRDPKKAEESAEPKPDEKSGEPDEQRPAPNPDREGEPAPDSKPDAKPQEKPPEKPVEKPAKKPEPIEPPSSGAGVAKSTR